MGRRSQRHMVSGVTADNGLAPDSVNKEKKRKKAQKRYTDKENIKTSSEEVVDPVFQRKREDGSTSLAILTPGEGVVPGTERDRPVSLGNYIGKVRYGAASIQGFKEDRRNQAKPVFPIFYPGGYSSHGPTFDSTFANLTSEDSKMVAPYFDFRKLENEDLIQSVCGEDYSEHFVDHLLDLMNGKDIAETVVHNHSDTKVAANSDDEVNFDYLSTLEQEGIDMSFLSNLQAHYELKNEPEMSGLSISEQLELTAHLIHNLKSAQQKRLSMTPPANLNALSQPNGHEMKLADRLVSGLTHMTNQVAPGDVAGAQEVRKAMGVVIPGSSIGNEVVEVQCNGLTNGHAEPEIMEM